MGMSKSKVETILSVFYIKELGSLVKNLSLNQRGQRSAYDIAFIGKARQIYHASQYIQLQHPVREKSFLISF
jgi:hypothetical protein